MEYITKKQFNALLFSLYAVLIIIFSELGRLSTKLSWRYTNDGIAILFGVLLIFCFLKSLRR